MTVLIMIKKKIGERKRERERSIRNILRDNDWKISQSDEVYQPRDSKNLQDSKQNKNKIISRHLIAKLFGNSFILQMRKLKLREVDSSL